MKVRFFTVAAATLIMGFGLQAQNSVSRYVTMDGKGKTTFEKKFSNKTSMTAKPEMMEEYPDFVNQEVKIIRRDGKILKQHELDKQKFFPQNGRKHQEGNFFSSVNVKKSLREDVATITFKVVGAPFNEHGFHLLLDADAEMMEFFWLYFFNEWSVLYDACEYKIPLNASPDISNPNGLVDDEVTIFIPGGIYDFVFFTPDPQDDRMYYCNVALCGNYLDSDFGETSDFNDFEFLNGYEYLFVADYSNEIKLIPEHEIGLTKIILPHYSSELTNQEEVTVVIRNGGMNIITGEIELTYKINENNWITPEFLTVALNPGDEISYTFNTKADFSGNGLYTVEAKLDLDIDLVSLNNSIIGKTKKPIPFELPFNEDFNTYEDFVTYWTRVNNKPVPYNKDNHLTWQWDDWNYGPDSKPGSLQMLCQRFIDADDYLISDPIILPEIGTYNISFWVLPFGYERLKILYGTTSNYEEMKELKNITLTDASRWSLNITTFDIETPGIYYFAFYYYSSFPSGGDGLNFDIVKIAQGEFVGIPDISFNKVFAPTSSCEVKESALGATVVNKGTQSIKEFTMTYQINDETPVSKTFISTIPMSGTTTVYFDEAPDFSAIGDFNILFSLSTPNEENLENNTMETSLTHFEPLNEIPFDCDFSKMEDTNNWYPAEHGRWGIDTDYGCYFAAGGTVPLLSRCITLEPGAYRFSFGYQAGFSMFGMTFKDDFYVSFGKSGTDPSTWKPVKEFLARYTEDEVWEDNANITITETDEYVIAFCPTFLVNLGIFSTSLTIAPEHDMSINSITTPISFPLMTPQYHILGENLLTVSIENKGTAANENGNIKLLYNDNEIMSENFSFTGVGEILNIEFKPVFQNIPVGDMKLKFNASLQSGVNSAMEIIKIVSDSTFAWDITNANSIGTEAPVSLGMIYELKKSDIYTTVTIGLVEIPYSGNLGLAVYPVIGDLLIGDAIFDIELPRTDGNDEEGITFDVPDTELTAGKYYFEIKQLDDNWIGIVTDMESSGFFYENLDNSGVLEQIKGYGNVQIRPNFGNPHVGIFTDKASKSQLTLYPNPTSGELRVENGELKMEKITVYNATGQVVMVVSNVNATSYKINVEKLNSGLYFISVQTKNGVVNSKFVVK